MFADFVQLLLLLLLLLLLRMTILSVAGTSVRLYILHIHSLHCRCPECFIAILLYLTHQPTPGDLIARSILSSSLTLNLERGLLFDKHISQALQSCSHCVPDIIRILNFGLPCRQNPKVKVPRIQRKLRTDTCNSDY